MKKIYTLLTLLLLTASVFLTQQATAQAPQKMSYQSVLRNSSNALVANTAVGIKISVLQGSSTGNEAYVETQTATTNANGLVSLQIGTGTADIGSFSEIDWANGPYFIKTETDPLGGTTYTIAGTQEMLSVPYAMYAAKSGDAVTMGAIGGSSSANGGTITAGVLNLAPADGSNGGIVTNGTQTIGGAKTYTQSVTANSFVKTGGVSSQYLMADGSTSPRTALGPVTTSTANGATLTNGILSLAQADGTNSGIVTPFTQTFGGDKTFTQSVTANSFVKTGGVSSQYLMADGSTSPRTTLGPVGGTSTSNGATLTNGTLSLTPADATNSGIITPFTQTFGGDKTFTQSVTANSFVKTGGVSSQYLMADGSTSPRTALGPVTTSTANGATLTNGILSLAQADGTNSGIVTPFTQTFGGDKTFTQSVTANSFVKTGGVSSQYLMADGSTSPRTALGPVTTSTANGATLTNGILSLAQADGTNSGIVTPFTQTFGGDKTFTQSVTANSFIKTGGVSSQYLMADGSTSTRISLGPVGGTSTSNGATLTNGTLSLTPADATNSGIITPFTQTFGGDKTFTQSVTANSFVKTGGVSSQYLMADGSTSPRTTLGPVGGTSTSNGATLTNGTLSLAPADATNSGIVTTGAQTFSGSKTFTSAIKITAGTPGEGKILTSDATGLASWQSASPCGYAIGQNVTALGGIIFYLDASGCHGLVCAPTDQSTGIRWYNGSFTNTTAFADCVGGGAGNTSMIIYNQGATATNYAAGLARAYTGGAFSDWYLPSKYELNLMHQNIGQGNVLGLGNVGGFVNNAYWSSTETSSSNAWLQYFDDVQFSSNKVNTAYVRAVRAF